MRKIKGKQQKLRWATIAFCTALITGVGALVVSFFPEARLKASFILVFTVFFLVFTIQYVNFHYPYKKVRRQIADNNLILPPSNKTNKEEQFTSPEPIEYNQLFIRIENYLKKESPYLDPNFKRSDLLLTLGTNERYLAIAIGSATGLTVQEYLTRIRIHHAMDELLIPDDNRTMEQIAFDSGFTTKRTFLRNFVRIVGQRPNEYREQNRSGIPSKTS